MVSTQDFLDAIQGYSQPDVKKSVNKSNKIAVIDPAYAGGTSSRVTFEGESQLSVKTYVIAAASYIPTPGDRVLMVPVGTSYVIVAPIRSTASGSYDIISSVDLNDVKWGDSLALPASNTAIYLRVRQGGEISKIALHVITSSGNISVAAYRNSGQSRSAVPGSRLVTSGAVACPSIGYAEVALASAVVLAPGDWLGISADNATAKFVTILAGGSDSNLGLGAQYRQATAHPLPSTPASLVGTIGYTFVLVGVP